MSKKRPANASVPRTPNTRLAASIAGKLQGYYPEDDGFTEHDVELATALWNKYRAHGFPNAQATRYLYETLLYGRLENPKPISHFSGRKDAHREVFRACVLDIRAEFLNEDETWNLPLIRMSVEHVRPERVFMRFEATIVDTLYLDWPVILYPSTRVEPTLNTGT